MNNYLPIKVKKRAQWAGICCGWEKHVDKFTKQKANKYLRRWFKKEYPAS
jgi:hypothetical protein